MQLLNDMFTGHLSKFGAKVQGDAGVFVEFSLTHVSKNEPSQDFLDNLAKYKQNNIDRLLADGDPDWDDVKLSEKVNVDDIKLAFNTGNEEGEAIELTAQLVSLKMSFREKVDSIEYKYVMTFLKRQEQDIDTFFATYLKYKDFNENGKRVLVNYDIELTKYAE